MAERTFPGDGKSPTRMRERKVAAIRVIPQERHTQIEFGSDSWKYPNTRSVCKPVIDGSVLENDMKQILAKERREAKKRQRDVIKEILLAEKERKSKIQYEKQMEEKQRKLKEQKQKDEQRRLSVEEKRRKKIWEDREKFKAVVSRTLERSNRIEQRLKRSSWEGATLVNSENKPVKKWSISTEKLEQGTCGSHKQKTTSSRLQNSVAKSIQKTILRYSNVPLPHSGELKNTIVPCKSTLTVTPQKKVETPLRVSMEPAPKGSVKAAPMTSVERAPKVSMEAAPKVNLEALPESVETSPQGRKDVSLVSVNPSPEMSMEIPSKAHREMFHKINTRIVPKGRLETIFEENMEVPIFPEASVEASPDCCPEVNVETSSEVKVRDTPQKSKPVNKKHPSTNVNRLHSPSCVGAIREIRKIRRPSVSLAMSKQSVQSSLSCERLPVHHTLYAQNVSSTIRMKAVSQKNTTYEEPGNKSTQGIMNAKEAIKILAAKQRLAREHKEKAEKLQKEAEQRKEKDLAKKAVEGQEEFSEFDNGQQQREMKKGSQDQENQNMLVQEGDTKPKVQEEANKHKKQGKIMLRNLQERSERKKRFDEIMKQMRKTDLSASKVPQTSSCDMYEEHEANDEHETGSDDTASFNDWHPSDFITGVYAAAKLKTIFRSTPRLLFLDVNSDKVYSKASSKSGMKNFTQTVKDPLAQAKDIRLFSKGRTNQVTKPRKTLETSNTMVPSKSLYSMSQKYMCDQILGITSRTSPLMLSMLPDSPEHHLEGSTTFRLSPLTPLDDKNRNESDSASSDM